MELLPPVDWADMARRSDVAEFRSDLVSGMRAMDSRLTGEIGGLRGEMGGLRGEMGELRGEMRALGSRVEAQFAKLVVANLLTSGALVGLVLGAVRLAGG
ncbi:hypothetical protein BH20ACT1_BH20ACT1_09760 [soil metagenome]